MDRNGMIEEFQCPGCLIGSSTHDCEGYKLVVTDDHFACTGHVPGTFTMPGGVIYLGLPKGFNKVGFLPNIFNADREELEVLIPVETLKTLIPKVSREFLDGVKNNVWLYDKALPEVCNFNKPVWYRIDGGFMYLRVYSPRINYGRICVVNLENISKEQITSYLTTIGGLGCSEAPDPDTID